MNAYLEAPVIVAAVTGVLSSVTTIVVLMLQKQTQQAIKTNHGSKNIGDAIDRLTDKLTKVQNTQVEQGEQLLDVREKQLDNANALLVVDEKLDRHIQENRRQLIWGATAASVPTQKGAPDGEAQ